MGLTPGGMDQLILSHLHFDHAGGLAAFAGTQAFRCVLVAEADLKQAWWSVTTGQKGPYIRSLFDLPGIRFETIRDTTWLAEDLGLFVQQAHTPGVLGMILKTQHHGTLLTTSDTLATAESYQHDLPPGTAAPAVEAAFRHDGEILLEEAIPCQPPPGAGPGGGVPGHPSLRPRCRPGPGLGREGDHRLKESTCPAGRRDLARRACENL